MLVRRRFFQIIALLLVLGLVLVACERPIPGSDTGETTTDVTPDANAGGGEPTTGGQEAAPTTAPAATESSEGDTPRVEEEPTATPEPQTDEQTAESGTEETTAEPTTAVEATATESSPETPTAGTPATHTVQAGENLYRIGLKYGISWVKLAEYNGLANPNMIKVGQVLKLSADGTSGGTTNPTVTPSPMTETTYTVKAGDNLFRIGLAYGISWVQIAEANGIVNPNQIKAGDVLKIPVSTPGPTPDFTHLVKAGETLFSISLHYGVAWTAIAEKNNIQSPYVIYVGQTLVIPGD
ncbi:MAG: LysM peptidoglycan-binding domain-containing protein [Anaerolineae bacterium]|jgi:LysM repeat protein